MRVDKRNFFVNKKVFPQISRIWKKYSLVFFVFTHTLSEFVTFCCVTKYLGNKPCSKICFQLKAYFGNVCISRIAVRKCVILVWVFTYQGVFFTFAYFLFGFELTNLFHEFKSMIFCRSFLELLGNWLYL